MNNSAKGKEALIFLHVPKSAGTTLNRLIEWEYPLFDMYSVDPYFFRWSRTRLFKLSQERLQRFRVFKGHMPFGLHARLSRPATYITVLRDPVDRVISAFYFMSNYKLHPNYWKFRREGWQLEDFVRRSPRENVQSKMMAGANYDEPCTAEILEKAKQNLAKYFSVVGLTERFEESLALMKLRFGWKLDTYSSFNVTRSRPKKRELSEATVNLIAETNRFDVDLYKFGATLFERAVESNPAAVAEIAAQLKAARSSIRNRPAAALFSAASATRKAINRAYSAACLTGDSANAREPSP